MQQTNEQVLDQVAMIHLDVHTWSGRKKLRKEDIKGDVPPKKLASLGSKRIVDPKKVATFESLKRRAERLLGSIGIRMMGTYAVPLDQVKELVAQLQGIKNEYVDAKAKFVSSYHRDVESWIAEQEEWGDIIRQAITPVDDVKRQLSFGWQVFRVKPTNIDDSGLDEEVVGMAGQLFREISREASRIFEESFLMKTKVGQRSMRPLRNIQEKLKGLSFLDGRAAALSDFLNDTLASLPQAGAIEGEQLNKIFGLLVVLSSPSKVEEYGEKLLQGTLVSESDLIALSGLDSDSASSGTPEESAQSTREPVDSGSKDPEEAFQLPLDQPVKKPEPTPLASLPDAWF